MKSNIIKLFGVSLIFASLISIMISCSSAQKKVEEPVQVQKTPEQIKKEMLLQEYGEFIDQKKMDTNIYWGEGIFPIGNDLGNAKIEAKKRALKDLSQKIEVQVTSELSRTLTGKEVIGGKKYSSQIEEEFVSKIRTYTDQLITDVQERDFMDYPRDGDLTYFAYISKSKYREEVEKDLDTKKMIIKSAILKGDTDFQNHRFLSGINSWISAKNYLDDFFGNLPMEIDLNNNGVMVEITSYLESRMRDFLLNISLSFMDDRIYYDAQGNVSNEPTVLAQYLDKTQSKYPLSQFPLKVEFIRGSGEVVSIINTGAYGEADIPMNYVDPQNIFSSIEVSIDVDEIVGLDQFSLPNIPTAILNFKKTKTVALVVYFENSGTLVEPNEVTSQVQSLFIKSGFNVISLKLTNIIMDQAVYEEAKNKNADYLYAVIVKTSQTSQVGGYDNMYKASCGGSVSLYKLPQKNIISSENIPLHEGFGVTREGACWDALGNLKEIIFKKTSDIIERL